VTSQGGRVARGVARLVAQAKLNLMLRIHARETSGFHAIETLFCRLALGDHVEVRALDHGERTLDVVGADTGPVERNLAWRAALAFQERAGWPAGFAVAIEKRIPVGGGLGGGSADAGAVLRALNALAPRPLPDAELLALGLPLGSDVPFLTATEPLALAWSRGERLLALPALPARRVVLATFPDGVPTADAYRWLAESRTEWRPTPALLDPRALASWEGVAAHAVNDFEPVVFARRPELGQVRAALAGDPRVNAGEDARLPTMTLMSGSGATVFRVDDGTPTLGTVAARVKHVAPQAWLLETTTAESVVGVEVAG
jgi:4-diphosphocytidyl-2-C-methyl-D-erythritol kinase